MIGGMRYDRAATCTFTGHRAAKLPWKDDEEDPRCLALKRCLFGSVEAMYFSGVRRFISGMSTGADFYFCDAVLELRETRDDILLEAAIPCPEQSRSWSAENRRRYQRLLEQCDRQTLIAPHYSRYCMIQRNRYMVDASGWLIAVYNGSPGGTRSTLLYAMRQGLQIVQLPVEA